MRTKVVACLLLLMPCSTLLASQGLTDTLSETRSVYVGKSVLLRDETLIDGNLDSWHPVTNLAAIDGNPDWLAKVPAKFLGAKGTVIRIAPGPPDETNFMIILVRLDQGETLAALSSPAIVSSVLELASTKAKLDAYIESNLHKIVGRTIYAVGWSQLFNSQASLDDLLELHKPVGTRVYNFPRLQPLKIAKARYFSQQEVILLELSSVDGQSFFSMTRAMDDKVDMKKPILSSVLGFLLDDIPAYLTQQEVAAVRAGTLFEGESDMALSMTVGGSDEEQELESGGKRLTYPGLVVTLDGKGKIVSWIVSTAN